MLTGLSAAYDAQRSRVPYGTTRRRYLTLTRTLNLVSTRTKTTGRRLQTVGQAPLEQLEVVLEHAHNTVGGGVGVGGGAPQLLAAR